MIVRNLPNGEQLLLTQTDHSRLAGRFAANWGNAAFDSVKPYESVVRAATFHDFGFMRYETAPKYDSETQQTPMFRALSTDANRLAEFQQAPDVLLELDPYAATIVRMHRNGLWRGRYGAMIYPPRPIQKQSPLIEEFIEKNDALLEQTIATSGWDPQALRFNYHLLQVWDLMSLYFSCADPTEDYYLYPVPVRYDDKEGEGVRMNFRPLDSKTVAVTPYPFDEEDLRIQLPVKHLKSATFPDRDALIRAYWRAETELLEYTLVNGEKEPTRDVELAGATRGFRPISQ
jgi:hypothetical protein